MLTEDKFPDGTQFGELTDSREFYSNLASNLDRSKVDPTECKEPRVDLANRSAETPSLVRNVVAPSGNQYAVAVVDGTIPRELVAATVSGGCTIVTATYFNGEFAVGTSRQTTTIMDGASDRFVYEQTNDTTSELPGDTSPPTTVGQREAFVWLGDSMVRVAQSSPTLDEDSRAEFDSILGKAIEQASS